MRSQLAACLEVPGCKGLGLIKLPLRRHHRELGLSRQFCAFLDVCVLLVPNPGYGRSGSGRGHWNQKKKISKGPALWSPEGKGA